MIVALISILSKDAFILETVLLIVLRSSIEKVIISTACKYNILQNEDSTSISDIRPWCNQRVM